MGDFTPLAQGRKGLKNPYRKERKETTAKDATKNRRFSLRSLRRLFASFA